MGNNHLDDGRNLAALSLGRRSAGAIFRVGVDCDRAATVDDMDELGNGMSGINWGVVFQDITREAPATDDDISYLQQSALAPLTEAEIAEVNASQRNPFPPTDPNHDKYEPLDPSRWMIPDRRFPESFVDFLRSDHARAPGR